MQDALEFNANWLRRFRRNLRAWYEKHGRQLPWRATTDPYPVWISEIMLQQTTVKAVIPYFERFLERFPTIEDVAAAREDEVLRYWEGLGYYSRARNIHKAARIIVHERDGQFPDELEELRQLPGIGPYTAGAIASFAFGRRAPIVEANTLRLYSRLLGYRGNPRSRQGQQRLWRFAEWFLPRRRPGEFNQALMELGSRVCTPEQPNCHHCPVRSCCRAFAEGLQHEIPPAPERPGVTDVSEATIAVRKGKAYLLRRRGEQERWAGLWDFPRFSLDDLPGPPDGSREAEASNRRDNDGSQRELPTHLKRILEQRVAELTGIEGRMCEKLTEIQHGVTRYRIRLICYRADYQGGRRKPAAGLAWVRPEQFGDYPLSVTGRKLARLLEKNDE